MAGHLSPQMVPIYAPHMPLGPHSPLGAFVASLAMAPLGPGQVIFEQCLVQEGYGMVPASMGCMESADRHELVPAVKAHEQEGASASSVAERLCALHDGVRPPNPLPPAFLDLAGLLSQHGLVEQYLTQPMAPKTALKQVCYG